MVFYRAKLLKSEKPELTLKLYTLFNNSYHGLVVMRFKSRRSEVRFLVQATFLFRYWVCSCKCLRMSYGIRDTGENLVWSKMPRRYKNKATVLIFVLCKQHFSDCDILNKESEWVKSALTSAQNNAINSLGTYRYISCNY